MINGGNEFNYYWIVLLMFKDVLLGLLGGLIAYLFDYKRAGKEGKEAVFKVSGVIINMALGAFVGYVIGTLLPPDTTARDALIALSGVTSYNIRISSTQNYLPDGLRARFNGLFHMLIMIGAITGQLLSGALGDLFDERYIISGFYAINLISLLIIMVPNGKHVKSIYNSPI